MRRPAPLLLFLAILAGSCSKSFDVERRESPVHVWLSVPGLAAAGGHVTADIALGAYAVVRDVVTYPRGVPTVELPTVYVRDGAYPVAVRLREAGVAVQQVVDIEGETWVSIVVRGGSVSISANEYQPEPIGN